MADAQVFNVSILLMLTLLSITYPPCFSEKAGNGGFSLELIRRDSVKSPFFRRGSFGYSPEATLGTITPENAQHLLKLSVGTPPRDVFAIVDTGSDPFWFQCLPCVRCYPQINPIFDPKRSSSFRELSCRSPQCPSEGSRSRCSGACSYNFGYGSAQTLGNLATETVAVTSRFGRKVSFRNIVFGCGHNNSGTMNRNEMGLIGFGRGSASFISQIGPSVGGRKFSICLMPFNTDSRISNSVRIGEGSEVQGPDVITMPLATTDSSSYDLSLAGISVGRTFLPYSLSGPAPKPNVLLDTGTPTTLLPQDLYDRVVAELKRQIPMTPPAGNFCYRNVTTFVVPRVTLHFDGRINWPLRTVQTFIRTQDGSFCFTMTGVPGTGGIIGSFAQVNYLVGYDIDRRTVSFKPADCTKIG